MNMDLVGSGWVLLMDLTSCRKVLPFSIPSLTLHSPGQPWRLTTMNPRVLLLEHNKKATTTTTWYEFSAEEGEVKELVPAEKGGSKELLPGLPGRLFRDKVPEWTPDVRFFRSDEYDVRGSLAVLGLPSGLTHLDEILREADGIILYKLSSPLDSQLVSDYLLIFLPPSCCLLMVVSYFVCFSILRCIVMQ
ncbi:Protein NLP4-like protein [Vigna angularis]|uniref:Protein NLP4-like protein n=1 Tax=Phaseolus angularis TaxID=3914 RepID=A0A8T0JNG1_PHAAN|nr:uncharacterized protein LOC108335540 [Vigna angularis]KAG2376969.1 Protein NLP4-like protein [Vigna angularis]